MYQIIFYQDSRGKSEVEEYIVNLNKKKTKDSHIKLNKIIAYMRMLKEQGLRLGTPYLKHLDGDIWELRPLRDRILFAYWDNNKFIILSQFIKKTQKTPKREIEKAKGYLEEYKKRSGNNE